MMQPRLTGDELLDALEAGTVRAAEPQADGSWRVEPWVKEGILDLFRASPVVPMGVFRDKAAFPNSMWGGVPKTSVLFCRQAQERAA